MGAAGLIEIKRRIKSVENTRKITNAMGLVATSKLRRCRNELTSNAQFLEAAEKTVKALAAVESDYESPFFTKKSSGKKLYIVITSDSGLCAGYNNNVTSFLTECVGNDISNTCIIAVGSKGVPYMRKLNFEIVSEYVDIPDVPTIKEIKVICGKALSLYNKGIVSEVNIIYTHFTSPVRQEVVKETLLPMEKVEGGYSEALIEPSYEVVLEDSLEIYLKGKLRNLMLSSKCSEQNSRMTAMNGATSNANDLLSALNIKYNRIRQSIITQEISEIVGGAEAQK